MTDNSFIHFIKERSSETDVKGYKSIHLSMNDSLWDLDVVKSSIPLLEKDGFNVQLDQKLVPFGNDGEEGFELSLIVEWK